MTPGEGMEGEMEKITECRVTILGTVCARVELDAEIARLTAMLAAADDRLSEIPRLHADAEDREGALRELLNTERTARLDAEHDWTASHVAIGRERDDAQIRLQFERTARLTAEGRQDAAVVYSYGALQDAIYTEDGLDGATGEAVIALLLAAFPAVTEARRIETPKVSPVARAEARALAAEERADTQFDLAQSRYDRLVAAEERETVVEAKLDAAGGVILDVLRDKRTAESALAGVREALEGMLRAHGDHYRGPLHPCVACDRARALTSPEGGTTPCTSCHALPHLPGCCAAVKGGTTEYVRPRDHAGFWCPLHGTTSAAGCLEVTHKGGGTTEGKA